MTGKQFKLLITDHPFIAAGIALVVIAFFAYVIIGIDSCNFRRGVEKDKQAIEDKKAEIDTLAAQKAELERLEAEKRGELKILEQQALEAEKQRIEVGNASNQALTNQNNIENQNFNGTSYEDAQKARCAAGFVEACK